MNPFYYIVYSHFLGEFIVTITKPEPDDKENELISWYRDFDVACEEAKKKNEGM